VLVESIPANAPGTPLAEIIEFPQPTPQPKPSVKNLVLLHFCFDQQSGERKHEHCPCEERAERVTGDAAEGYVQDGCADWLVVRNARAKSGTSVFRCAIVIRSIILDAHKLFKVPSKWKPIGSDDRRAKKHADFKRTIFDDARNLLRMYFSRGWISQKTSQMTDSELEHLFTNPGHVEAFLGEHNRPSMRKEMMAVILHWWSNILGYQRLNTEAGKFMEEADRGTGLVTTGGHDATHPDVIDGAHETDAGRVAVANHKASFWCGAWDYSTGTAPSDENAQPAGHFNEGPIDQNDEIESAYAEAAGFEPVDEKQE